MASIFRRIFGAEDNAGQWVRVNSQATANILGYAGRTTDRSQIRDAIVRRYGTRLELVKDAATGISYSIVKKSGFEQRIDAGHIETVSIGFGHKVAAAIATMFSEETQNFELVAGENAETNTEPASDLLDDMRGGGLFVESLVQADIDSIWVGCMPVFVEFGDDSLVYRPTDPGKIQVLFEASIESNGQTRSTNRLDIEDATCVVIETGMVDDYTHSYVAIFGRSSQYPQGRYVVFNSSGDGTDIPKPGSDDTWDWLADGEVANPLSWYADAHPDEDIPEYPIAIIHSCLVTRDRLFPISTSLLTESLEADVAASHIRATSGDNARGTRVLTKSDEGGSQPIPKSLYGEVVLEAGQTLTQVDTDANAPKVAWDLLKEETIASGLGYSVPDFYTSSDDHTVEAASGAALIVRSRQLSKLRGRRIETNAPSVKKIFAIEKALISMMAPESVDESAIALLESCEQNWDPGKNDAIETETEKVAAVKELSAMGLYDTIEQLRIIYNLTSESEAIEKYQQLQERRKKYPPLDAEEKKAAAEQALKMKTQAAGGNDDAGQKGSVFRGKETSVSGGDKPKGA
jgi:hypothetical protein